MSRRSTAYPALAKWAAIREPIVPAPSTATRRSGVILDSVSRPRPACALRLQKLLHDQAVALHTPAQRHLRLHAAAHTVEQRATLGQRVDHLPGVRRAALVEVQQPS